MSINKLNVAKAVRMVGAKHVRLIVRLAEEQETLEKKWIDNTEDLNEQITAEISASLKATGKAQVSEKIFEEFLLTHYFKVVENAVDSVDKELRVITPIHMAKPKKPAIPKSLRDLREVWDRYRSTGKLPKGMKDQAKKIQKDYLKKTQSVWKKYSEDFRSGDEMTQENVLRKVQKAAGTAESRAKTVIRTETTNYYNQTRREMYDQSDAIWGYLFLAIRDQGTTKWCTDKVRDGKRGRHGLVYKKGDPLTDKECPSCHWNCRSEFTPLTMYNPRHRKLIEDLRLHRRNNTCHPLPIGWR